MSDGARALVDALGLARHPEGGWYRRTWTAPEGPDGRPVASAIYYLLEEHEPCRRHRIDADELWHHYAGAPLELVVEDADGTPHHVVLGPDVARGERPQHLVAAGAWQSARALGPYALCGATVVPGFVWEGWEAGG